MWDVVQFRNYYVPHISIAFLSIGLFLALAYKPLAPVRRKVYGAIFFFLALMSGLAGISNVFVCVGTVCFILCLRGALGGKAEGAPKVFLLFFVVQFVFNAFVIVTTEFSPRFFVLPLVFVVPVIPVLLQEATVSRIKRYLMALPLSVAFVTGAVLSFGSVLTSDSNKDKHAVAAFLQDHGYGFGYASFWNANVLSYLTDGKLEVAHFFRARRSEVGWDECVTNSVRPDRWISDRWLTPDRYYRDDAGDGRKVFFWVTQDEYNAVPDAAVFANGKLVYNDAFYRVYEHDDNNAFKKAFLPARN